jgi:hypothetical protein
VGVVDVCSQMILRAKRTPKTLTANCLPSKQEASKFKY